MPNQLIHETSPYLLQHANNPVEWLPWGLEALEKARKENKPIFLSIGYAACHWCHVMEHESFEDPQTAEIMNEHFVSIKVDREERPDLDSIYMGAVVAMTGQGGWPMSVFLTPEGEPFYGGTYFPATSRYGMAAFRDVLMGVANAWKTENSDLRRTSAELTQHLRENSRLVAKGSSPLREDMLQQAAQVLIDSYNEDIGSWGGAPLFPQPMAVEFLLTQAERGSRKALDTASHLLLTMSRGGLFDVVGGGFHRYSTDNSWLVPHFEKMLYDNGQLALAYLHGYMLTDSAEMQAACTQTLDFIAREMTHPSGGFYSSLDADSEGEEGKYYLWTAEEINQALPDIGDRSLIRQIYAIAPNGNFEGKYILQRNSSLEDLSDDLGLSETELVEWLASIHQQLYAARERRVRPMTDDKVLVSWNALALRAFAQAARYLKRTDYLEIAQKNADFLLDALIIDGRLMRAWRNGQARHPAFLEDYAGLAIALLDLYQSDQDPRWYNAASRLCIEILERFQDPAGGFFDNAAEHGQLIARPKDIQDNATPSGSALAAYALLYMAAFDERGEWRSIAEGMLSTVQDYALKHPTAFSFWLQGFDFAAGPVRQVAIVGPAAQPDTQALLAEIWRVYRPRVVVAVNGLEKSAQRLPALLHERGMLQGKPTVYVCQDFTCNLPVHTIQAVRQQLG